MCGLLPENAPPAVRAAAQHVQALRSDVRLNALWQKALGQTLDVACMNAYLNAHGTDWIDAKGYWLEHGMCNEQLSDVYAWQYWCGVLTANDLENIKAYRYICLQTAVENFINVWQGERFR